MDFSKLNTELSNMQVSISRYNKLLLEINNKIKSNVKEINKYETKLKSTKNTIEKESYNLIIVSLKNEVLFLESLLEDEKNNEKRSTSSTI